MSSANADAPTTAGAMTQAVRSGDLSAIELLEAALSKISASNDKLACFTDLTTERARAQAVVIDQARASGAKLGPLAGVPYGVKNLFDLAGVSTRAGSKINRDNPPATSDAFAVGRLEHAGAMCIGALNMGEYAYDFTGENAHDGHCRNPHNPKHMAGGSSSGPAAAVAAGMVPFSLGTDTNGSIRVPSSYCGLFGFKPTFGRLSRAGVFPFCASLDHIGPLATSTADLALVYDALLGWDANDPVQSDRSPEPVGQQLEQGAGGLRIAVAEGYFRSRGSATAYAAVDKVARALDVSRTAELPQAERARAAAFLITAAESAGLHLDRLKTRAEDFDPMMRDRLLAGAMIPAPWVTQAQRFRQWYQAQVAKVFKDVDIILAPATPTVALEIGQQSVMLDGQSVPARQGIGIYTQPISFAGLPVVTVPVWQQDGTGLPIGVQIIAAPWHEAQALRIAYQLENQGVCESRIAANSY